jgi:hypothetical protein
MEKIKHFLDDSSVLQQIEKYLSDDFFENNVSPRLYSLTNTLDQVEKHFHSTTNKIDKPTLELYRFILKAETIVEALAFLWCCAKNTVSEKFHEIPTKLISQMVGRACKTRDLSKFTFSTSNHFKKQTLYSKSLITLIGWENCVCLMGKNGDEIEKINLKDDFKIHLITPIPTESALEQFVIISSKVGQCIILSTTRKSLRYVGEFSLDVPSNEEIQWIDIINSPNYYGKCFICWGSNDCFRGKINWNFYAGLNLNAMESKSTIDSIFFDASSENVIELISNVYKLAMANELEDDFTWHGNLLTLWTQYKDSEDTGIVRIWKPEQCITIGSSSVNVLNSNGIPLEFCWGTPNQYITLNIKNSLQIFVKGEKVGDKEMIFSSARNDKVRVSGCILNAHSR